MTGKPVTLDGDSFGRHVERSQFPVVVDFWHLGVALAK